ncbi:MAG: CHASE4 domain-containing protein [Candidatus Riflebacteria bacterium]|nr:CHASE4 domain-containing protein [Candidatus Riflebacteria bacterium]
MKPSLKVWLLVAILVSLILGSGYLLRNYLIIPEFIALEQKEADKDMGAIADALHHEAFHLQQLAGDWAAWDDMYEYVIRPTQSFASSNFRHESLTASGIDIVCVCDLNRKLIWGSAFDPAQKQIVAIPELSQQALLNDAALFSLNNSDNVTGFMSTENGLILVSAHQILTSAKTGPPRGTVILGRFLKSTIIENLAGQTRVQFKVKPQKELTATESALLAKLQKNEFLYDKTDPAMIIGFQRLDELQGLPAMLIEAKLPREILTQGKSIASVASTAIIAAMAIICVFLILWVTLFKAENQQRQKQIESLVEMRTTELKESEERLRTIINATPDIICLKDSEGRWLLANQAVLELFCLTGIDYRGKTATTLADSTNPVLRESILASSNTDEHTWQHGSILRCIESISGMGATTRIFDVIKIPVFHADGRRKALIVFGRDVTCEKSLHEKLQRAEKMEAIGMMAGGVAHDLNNILSGIIGYPELLLMQIPQSESKIRRMIEGIRDSGKRASEIVADLLTVARGVVATRETKNVNNLILEYLDSPECKKLKTSHPKVEILTDLDDDLFNISCSPVHIKKCLMNLVTNASESIKERGKVTIATRNFYINEASAETHNLPEGDYVVVKVTDTGSGISPEDISRIFEPFYTKKVMGRSGTGLGLAVVWNTVQNHAGSVFVTSSQDGSTFEMFFPVTRLQISTSSKDISIEDLQGKGQTILVVDDEASQRDIASSMLTSLGYKVDAVDSGRAAIDYLTHKQVDLLILDMIMDPGMRGRETYEQIVKIRPGQKAVIASGFADDEEVKLTQKLGAGQFVKKPYLLNQIGLAVKKALNNHS